MLSLVIAQNCSWPAIARGAATLTKTCLSFVVSFQVSSELHILLLFCYAVGHFPLSWHWGLVLRASRISIVLKACDPGSIPAGSPDCATLFALFLPFFSLRLLKCCVESVDGAHGGAVVSFMCVCCMVVVCRQTRMRRGRWGLSLRLWCRVVMGVVVVERSLRVLELLLLGYVVLSVWC